jgi:hypothetical protein
MAPRLADRKKYFSSSFNSDLPFRAFERLA